MQKSEFSAEELEALSVAERTLWDESDRLEMLGEPASARRHLLEAASMLREMRHDTA